MRYVKDQQYPDLANDNDKRTLRKSYKKSKNQILLRCVDAKEAKKIVQEIYRVFAVHTLADM